ncbi:hypothetical protein DYH09_33610 [bacterium CPR1]|nr:hypothetical protein [bacterium CPR1]
MNSTQKHRPLIPSWFAAMIMASLILTVFGTIRQVGPGHETQNPRELLDVLWIDSYPEVTSDTWNAYIFSSDNVGISIQAASAYKLTLELFEFKPSNTALSFHFPHDARRSTSNYAIEKMKKPTKHFDTQLSLSADPQKQGKSSVYFTGPEFRSLDTMPAPVREALMQRGVVQTESGLQLSR